MADEKTPEVQSKQVQLKLAQSKSEKSPQAKKVSMAVMGLALLCSLLVGATAFLVYQQWHLGVVQTSKVADNNKQLADQQLSLRSQFESIEATIRNNEEQYQAVSQQLEELAKQMQNQAVDDKQWLTGEIGYLLQLAQYQLSFSNNTETVINLLESANQRLAQLNDPKSLKLRQKLSAYLAKIKAAPSLDTVGILTQLDALAEQLPVIYIKRPVKAADGKASAVTSSNADKNENWKKSFKQSLQGVNKLVVIRHHDEKIVPLMPPNHHQYLLMNMHVQLVKAQWAVLNVNDEVFQASLTNCQDWLVRYFDIGDPATKAFSESLNALKKHELKHEWPEFDMMLSAFLAYKTNLSASTD